MAEFKLFRVNLCHCSQKNKIMKKNYFKRALVLFTALTVMSSCKKDSESTQNAGLKLNDAQAVTIVPGASAVAITDGGGTISRDANNAACQSYHVLNFFQGTINPTPADPHDRATTYYFNLFDNKGGNSGAYDLVFTGTANGDVSAVAGGQLAYVDKAYCDVVASDFSLTNIRSIIGKENTINFPTPPTTRYTGPGWYNYDFSVHILQALTGRTLIYKAVDGTLFKIQLESLYENGTPNAASAATNFPYFKFKYAEL